MSVPKYDDLPIKPEYPPHSAWGVWGEDDELGTLVSPDASIPSLSLSDPFV